MGNTLVPYDSFASAEPGRSMPVDVFVRFRGLIREQTGISLRDGKEVMLASRLNRRLRHHGLSSYSEYLTLLRGRQDGGVEMREFINCVTTNKTSFFRESHHFDFLANTVVPEAVQRASSGQRTLRVWSAACSTGEEPYSIAMTLLHTLAPGWQIAVEASDIDTAVLETARKGVYPLLAVEEMDEAFCRTFFLRGKDGMNGMVRVRPAVCTTVNFQRINLIDSTWPIEGGLDAIFFRNALIYFDQEIQERFLRRMLRLLRPDGYLFLGHSENVPWLYDAVTPLSKTVYQKLPCPKAGGGRC